MGILTAFITGCTPLIDDQAGPSEDGQLVGGATETGYRAAGYLITDSDKETPFCGATLIAPRMAVTAAHCVKYVEDELGDEPFSIGFGNVGAARPIRIINKLIHPRWHDYGDPEDLAVLILAGNAGERPAQIGDAKVGDRVRQVSFGSAQSGGMAEQNGASGGRKSALFQIVADEGLGDYRKQSSDAGICWGDSGSGVFLDGTSTLVGVASRFADDGVHAPSCSEGQPSIAHQQSIDHRPSFDRGFIAAASTCQGKGKGCGAESDTRCVFDCADYDYAPGDRSWSWLCDPQGCLRHLP